MIEASRLSKNYDGKAAVVELNLTIPAGECFCFLGPNGAGKTTTIKMLTGLLIPSAGQVKICGRDIQREPVEAKRFIGYVPDRPYLYDKLSGSDFLRFVGDLFDIPRDVQARRAAHFLEMFRLTGARDEFVENYSHGMRQKLVFAAALLHDPQVLIIDEPMVGLDPQSARTIKTLLRDEIRAGKTVFLSTHTLSVAEELADRIGVIHHGRMLFLGSIGELRRSQAAQAAPAGAGGNGGPQGGPAGESKNSLEDLFLQLTAEEETGEAAL